MHPAARCGAARAIGSDQIVADAVGAEVVVYADFADVAAIGQQG